MAHAQKPGFLLSTKWTSTFKLAGASVQSTTGSRGMRISGSNAGYTMLRGSVKSTGYPLHSRFPFTSPPVRHRMPLHINWTLTILFTPIPCVKLLVVARSTIPPKCCSSTGFIASGCNRSSSEKFSIFSIFGSTMWVLIKLTVVFLNECGSSLKFIQVHSWMGNSVEFSPPSNIA
jgi:hypothetical protein